MLKRHVPLIPVTVNTPEPPMVMIYHKDSIADLENPDLPGDDAWTIFTVLMTWQPQYIFTWTHLRLFAGNSASGHPDVESEE